MVLLASDTFLTATEFAQEFRITSATVRMWCAQGILQSFKLPGGSWRIPASEVARLKNGLPLEVAGE
jgi:excisionase family DNA binding protein